jgi:hypothetical protein
MIGFRAVLLRDLYRLLMGWGLFSGFYGFFLQKINLGISNHSLEPGISDFEANKWNLDLSSALQSNKSSNCAKTTQISPTESILLLKRLPFCINRLFEPIWV